MELFTIGGGDDDARAFRTLALSADALHLSTTAVRAAADLTGVPTTDVPFDRIERVTYADGDTYVLVEYRDGLGAERVGIDFDDAEGRRRVTRRLERVAGITRTEEPRPLAEAVVPVLTAGGGLAVAGAIFSFAAAGYDGGAEYRGGRLALFRRVVGFVGPTGWLILTALAIAGTAYLAYRRYRDPGVEVVLRRA